MMDPHTSSNKNVTLIYGAVKINSFIFIVSC